MRVYHVYKQLAFLIKYDEEYSVYEWQKPVYIGWVYGTKELRGYFNRCMRFKFMRPQFSMEFSSGRFENLNRIWFQREQYIIIDDKGRFRDYYDLISQIHKSPPYVASRVGYTHHYFNTVPEQRKSITPEEILEIKDEYGINIRSIKPKRNINFWGSEKVTRVERSWKAQTKRRRQYKAV